MDEQLKLIRQALLSEHGRIRIVLTFTHGHCAQVYQSGRKVGPLIIPSANQNIGDVLKMLGELVL
jgi:hypothetical protein